MSPRSRTRPAPSAVVREKALAAGAGLLATRIGLQPVGRQMLAAADYLPSSPAPAVR